MVSGLPKIDYGFVFPAGKPRYYPASKMKRAEQYLKQEVSPLQSQWYTSVRHKTLQTIPQKNSDKRLPFYSFHDLFCKNTAATVNILNS